MKQNKVSGFEKIALFIVCTGTVLYYGFFYNNHLYQKEQLQLFETTFGYFLLKISRQGGFADYTGEFLVQFFGLPLAGAAIIGSLLALIIILTRRIIYHLTFKEPFLLFSFLPAAGYFIVLQNNFYSFSGVAGFLISLLASLCYLALKKPWKRVLAGTLLIPVVYWMTGAAYMTFVLILFVSEIIFRFRGKEIKAVPASAVIVYLILGAFVPAIARILIIEDNLLVTYVSESWYRIRIFFPLPLVLILISVPFFILLQEFLPSAPFASGSTRPLQLNIISFVMVICFLLAGILLYGDSGTEDQMAYDNLVNREKWYKIIERAERKQPQDRISMVAVNLALAKTGQMSSNMFSFRQRKDFLFLEYERKGMTPFLASEPFYHLGLINFAQMFAVETLESTPDAKYPSRSFRRIASTYLINGQYDIALKYLKPLSHTIFYRKWARECMRLSESEDKIRAHPYWGYMRSINTKSDFFYNSGQMDIALRYILLSNPGSRIAYEYLMAYYLLDRDLDGFLKYIPLSGRMNYGGMPKAWQEAAVYIATRVPELPPQLAGMNPEQKVVAAIKSYADLFSAQAKDTARIRNEFGDTYWYYLHFVK